MENDRGDLAEEIATRLFTELHNAEDELESIEESLREIREEERTLMDASIALKAVIDRLTPICEEYDTKAKNRESQNSEQEDAEYARLYTEEGLPEACYRWLATKGEELPAAAIRYGLEEHGVYLDVVNPVRKIRDALHTIPDRVKSSKFTRGKNGGTITYFEAIKKP
jgi:hypothetical protein